MVKNLRDANYRICAFKECGLPFFLSSKDRKTRKYCSRDCYKLDQRKFESRAYPQVWWNGKRELLHRVIYMEYTGEKLTSDEIIHHKDENPFNRSPENLEKLSGRAAHLHKHNYHKREKPAATFETEYVDGIAIRF